MVVSPGRTTEKNFQLQCVYIYIGYNHNTYHHYGRSGGYRRYRRRRRCGKCVTGGCGQDDEDDHHGRAATETMGEHHHPLLVVDYLCVRERYIYIYISVVGTGGEAKQRLYQR